ncbi:hypothetical protein [Paenibacillus crassostreae]|uniref:Aminoglycoside phosphotransferase domain-containing protein n=1 Tax=Paenibacillus crassostreae TaxID=1763538 RepID=A0A167DW04_9BACL|nr:hypothetical protein [Paenibacillus crassostreae]AOZ90993.1 hypothetical protein LPB68_01430 [Paenibacillus crassostreae]OAB74844.1 hypothetical protein PNBC_12525 [Paenibacillus crassostreae]
MELEITISEINTLFQLHNIKDQVVQLQRLSGTTNGIVLRLESIQGSKYILKFDYPNQIHLVEQLLNTYKNSVLLPKILFTAQDNSHFLYTFIDGTTHFNRGTKKNWLTILVKELLNKYVEYHDSNIWGRIEYPRQTWKEFNEISIEEAKINIGSILTNDDYKFVKLIASKLFDNELEQGERYLLHGDTGVHNFVFDQFTLIGVIDPSPMVGPLIYDFIYAFCSSPDDINIETLFTAYDYLKVGRIEQSRLIEEVSVQLYCRVGLSVKHHQNDLPEYIKAWKHWKGLCKQFT